MALERRLGRQDSLLAALDVLLIGRRETAVSVEGNGIFLRHMYAALRLELPAAVGPDQRDRNDLLIVSDMFQVRERRVELGHIEVGVIADVAKPVVPVLLRRADEVVFIVLAEQIVGVLMLLRIIYDALDLNSHFKLFQLVIRRGFGRGLRLPDGVEIGGRGGCCNRIARFDGGLCCVRIPSPAEEGVALSARLIAGNGERHRAGTALQRHRFGVRHVGDGIRRVLVVGQGVLGLFFFTGYGDGEGRGFLPPIAVSFILDQASTSVAITNFASMVIVIIECQLHCRCAGLCRSKVERQARKALIFVIAIPAGNGPAEILQDSRVAELDCRRACRIVVGNKFG